MEDVLDLRTLLKDLDKDKSIDLLINLSQRWKNEKKYECFSDYEKLIKERIKLDIWYVNNLTFKLDLKIFFLTIFKILRQDGITAGENIIMSPFQGLSKKKDEEY